MTPVTTNPINSGARRAEQIVVLLDNRARILSVNTGLAGSGFLGLAKERQSKLHERLHPACRGKCRFKKLWKTAWRELTTNDSVEWEINDAVSGKFLRLNLTKPPSTRVVEHDRRQGHALLTITDITRHRREYETLVRRERTLIKLLQDQGLETSAVLNSNSDNVASTPPIGAEGAEQSVRVLSRQAILAQEDERRRIARELHDSIAQLAGVIKYNIEAEITRLSMPNTAVDRAALEGVVDEVRELIEEVRRVSNNLAPSMLEDFGLCAALRGLCSDFRSESCSVIPVCDTCVDESKIPDIIRFTVYRVAQEAMNNIGKHSMATMASVDLRGENGGLRLLIEDNGAGFDINHVAASETNLNRGAGLRNMRDRVQVTGGEFSIRSEPGQGVAIESSWSADNLALLLGDETVLYGIDGNG